MTRFMMGVERATKAIHEALLVAGYNDAAEFVRKTFVESIEDDNIEFTLEKVFGISKRELASFKK